MVLFQQKRRFFHAFFLCLILLLMAFFPSFALPPNGEQYAFLVIYDDPVPLAPSPKVLEPVAGGKEVFTGSGALIDATYASEGYVMVRYNGPAAKAKIQIMKAGEPTYTYDLRTNGRYETIPFTCGDGLYSIFVYTGKEDGHTYSHILSARIDVELDDPMLPFLTPNYFVNYNCNSKAVELSQKMAKSASNDLKKVQNVYDFVVEHISYDSEKAETVQPGYLPNADRTLKECKGICLDYAVLMTAMLRCEGIPTRLEVGYTSTGAYHAWVSVYLKKGGKLNEHITIPSGEWTLLDPTFASNANQSDEIMAYIGDGTNYNVQYYY